YDQGFFLRSDVHIGLGHVYSVEKFSYFFTPPFRSVAVERKSRLSEIGIDSIWAGKRQTGNRSRNASRILQTVCVFRKKADASPRPCGGRDHEEIRKNTLLPYDLSLRSIEIRIRSGRLTSLPGKSLARTTALHPGRPFWDGL